jgi:hypothetical protein
VAASIRAAPARAVTDTGLAECFRLTGHGQLRAGQGQRVRDRPDAVGGRGVACPRGAQQVPGLAAQMIEAGTGQGDRRDLLSLPSEADYVLPADPEAPSRTRSHGNQRGVLLPSDGRAGRPGSPGRRRRHRPCG